MNSPLYLVIQTWLVEKKFCYFKKKTPKLTECNFPYNFPPPKGKWEIESYRAFQSLSSRMSLPNCSRFFFVSLGRCVVPWRSHAGVQRGDRRSGGCWGRDPRGPGANITSHGTGAWAWSGGRGWVLLLCSSSSSSSFARRELWSRRAGRATVDGVVLAVERGVDGMVALPLVEPVVVQVAEVGNCM